MKKRHFVITLFITVSVVMNTFSIYSYFKAKNQLLFLINSHLVNIVKSLENMQYDEGEWVKHQYLTDTLAYECLSLDARLSDSLVFCFNGYTDANFKVLATDISQIYSKSLNSDDFAEYISPPKEAILELIAELSANRVLKYDDYSMLTVSPNYRMGIRGVIKAVNSFWDKSFILKLRS
jgi:hypothetical protein